MNKSTSLIRIVAALVGTLCLAGCGHGDRPPLGQVQGVVKLGGQPLAKAMVCFHPEKGHPSSAVTDADGHYELIYLPGVKGAVAGKHKVEIRTVYDESKQKERLPACYNSKSILEQEVTTGSNEFDFDLNVK